MKLILHHYFIEDFQNLVALSTNHIVCHGIPKDKILKEGDIVNVDVTAKKKMVGMVILVECILLGEVSTKAKN